MQESLPESSQRYKIDLEICPTPILLVGADGLVVRTNSRLDDLFGYASDELTGQSVEVLVPESVRSYHSDLRNAYFEVPTSRRMGTGRDLYGVRQDGKQIPVEIGLDPLEFDGAPMVLVSVLDISERKNSEAMIRRALNAASGAMIQVDEAGSIELVNERACQLFGYGVGEMIGRPIEMLVPERFRRKHAVYLASYQNSRVTRNMGSGRELFGVRKDGSEFPVEIGLTPIPEMQGRSTMATVIDITDMKAREKHIAEKNAQLERLNQELLQFAYSASHDLKAPLASIVGLLTYCESDLEDGDLAEVRSNIQKSHKLADRLSKRIEDMLMLAKSDMIEGDFVAIDVGQRVDRIWSELNSGGVTLETDFQHATPFCSVAIRFDALLENLLSNAVKYRNKSRSECVVKVATRSDDSGFELSVQDNGIGIPPEHREKVFDLFQRVADSAEPGSGLGLAIVKKHVEHLGGAIDFECADGLTTFTVQLPRSPAQRRPED